jgi:hypothetical protein
MESLHTKIQKSWKKLIFRRVHEVIPEGDPLCIIRKQSHDEFKEITETEYKNLSSDIRERECEKKFLSYSGWTNSEPLSKRINQNDYDHTIFFHSNNYCELDMFDESSSFYFNPDIPACKIVSSIPRPRRTITRPIRMKEATASPEDIEKGNELIEKGKTLYREAKSMLERKDGLTIMGKLIENLEQPDELAKEAEEMMKMSLEYLKKGRELLKREWVTKMKKQDLDGDLICGVLGHNKNRFQFWFIASEQFYKFFQLVMFGNHPELNSRKKILSGNNRLCTNTYRKKLMEIEGIKKEIERLKTIQSHSASWADIVELDEDIANLHEKLSILEFPEYWSLRGEKIGQEFCHIYPALALLCIYKEKLSNKNVPGGLSEWNVPGWLLKIN